MNQNLYFQDIMIKLVDSHCHLNFPDYENDLDDVIKRAHLSNVKYMLCISISLDDFDQIYRIVKKYQNIWFTTGIHPNNVDASLNEKKMEKIYNELKTNIKNQKVVGLGETGLDYYRDNSNKKNQLLSFESHLKLSGKEKLPTVVHSRSAEKDTKEMIKRGVKVHNASGLLHCFSSTEELARVALDNNFYISIAGMVTFKNSDELKKIIKFVPLNKLLIETDSPYLSPVPMRGKRNEPSFIIHTLEMIAKIKNEKIENVANSTSNNFFKLFNRAER